jgi:hypothetical protein
MTIEVGPNLGAFLLALLALVGSIVTAVLAYFNGQRLRQVERNTNGMTDRLVAAAYREGKALGHAEERSALGLPQRNEQSEANPQPNT